ncbi:MAG: Sensor protein [Polyangiaceae bacterium]|jgi:CheY-like chemotaxis protein|nr:Sensor protein [Polyangiaceae bacterium]
MSQESDAPRTASGERPAALATGFAHEVRAPLAVILGNAASAADQLLAARTALEGGAEASTLLGVVAEVHEALAEIRAAAQRIERAIFPVPSAPPTAVASERRRILVVDDDESIRKVMKRMLREYEVDTASDGEAALRLLSSRPEYDVILCDLVMPGMDGIALYEELERRSPELLPRMIFVTGGMAGPRAAEFRRALGHRFLDKPFAPPVLLALMTQLFAPVE